MSADELAQLLDPEHNWAFLPKLVVLEPGTDRERRVWQTFCNTYAKVFGAARGVLLPAGSSANELHDWLIAQAQADLRAGRLTGWRSLNEAEANQAVLDGDFVVAALKEGEHGHIAPLLPPNPAAPATTRVSAAGGRNFNATELVESFGVRKPGEIAFFAHPVP